MAAQTISSSVADAIDFLRTTGHPQFINSEATVEFLRIYDRIFDLMNSRTPFQKGYKAPLYLNNKQYWSSIFKETKQYILNLSAVGQEIIRHRRKTFAVGFLANIYSFENLASELLNRPEHPLKYFLKYKCSPDHLELFFSCIRSRGGWNNKGSYYLVIKLNLALIQTVYTTMTWILLQFLKLVLVRGIF